MNELNLKSEGFSVKVSKAISDKTSTDKKDIVDSNEDFTDFIEGNQAEIVSSKNDCFSKV